MKKNRYTYLLILFMSICPGISLMAQGVCSSSALAPVYSETFGTSSSPTKKNSIPADFVTNYKFNGSSALSDGEYIVTPQVQNSQRNDWAKGNDHTGNTNGNMYMVNAGKPSSGPVDLFFSKQVDNLCPGSVYSFSAWLVNVNTISNTKSICGSDLVWPKVTFNIKNTSGTILQSYTTDTLPLTKNRNVAPNWQQYGFQFTLPAGTTSLILEMRDGWGGEDAYCGNDLAIDDIVFSACTPTATATLSTGSNICGGTATSINSSLVNSPFSNPAYQWQQSTDGGTTWVDIGTAGTGSANYTIASAATTHSGMYRVIVGPDVSSLTSTTCVTASNAVSLSVNPVITVTATSNSPVCSGNTLSFSSTTSGGTGPFTYSWTGPNGFSSILTNPSISNVGTVAAGTYTFTATDSKNCAVSVSIPVTVGTTPPSVGAITGADGGCAGTSMVLGNSTSGGTWTSGNTAVATVAADGTVSMLSSGSAVITYTVNNGSCSVSASKTITVASVTLHSDVIECNNGIAHFDATDSYYGVTYSNNNAGNSFAWTVTGGPFTFQGSATASSQYPGMQFQTGYSYQVILRFTTNGVTCIDTQTVYKNVIAADTIQGSRDTTVCFNSAPISLSGKASPVTNTFKWTTTGTGTFSNPNALSTTYTPSLADKTSGTIKIYLSGSSTFNATGNCGSSTSIDSMVLRIYPDNVGTNSTQVICSNQALNFTPSSAIPGSTFSWASAVSSGTITGNSPSGTGNIIDSLVNLSNTNDAVVVYTITPYAFTPSNVSCSGTPFTFTVTARPKPAITITNTTSSVCTGSNTNLQFSSSLAGSSFTWNSSVVSGSVTGNSSNATASATNTITDVLTAAAGTNVIVRYRITAISPLGCSRTDSTDILVYGASTIANAGADQTVCNVNSVLLAANNPVLGNGSWTQLSGPTTAVFGSASSASTTLGGLVPGTYRLVWSITNGTCPASTDTVDIINAPPSVAGTLSADATVCSGNNSGTLSLSGYTGNILNWESSTDNGNTWISIANTTNTYSYNNITVTTVFRAVVQSGVCASVNSAPVTILVNPVSVPGTVSSDATVCSASNSGTLSLAGYTGSILRWESSIDNGASWNNISNTTANHDYTNLTSTTLFRAVVQSGICGALSSNAATITVTVPTVAGTVTANATVCTGSNNGTLNLGGYTGNILNWESSTDNGATWTSIANTTSQLTYNNLTTTTQYRATVQSGACPAFASAAATITTLLAVSTANAGADQQLCNVTSAALAGNTPSSGSGTWSFVSGPSAVTFSNANDPASVVNGLSTGTYQLAWTIGNGVCAPSQDIVQITINPQTVPGTLSASATVCASANSGTLALTGYTGLVVNWQSSTDNGSTWNNISNTTDQFTYTNLTTTTQYRVTVQSGVCNPIFSNIITITVLQAVTTANAGADQQLCNVTSAALAGNTPVSGTGTWSLISGPSAVSFTNANSPSTTLNGLTAGTYQLAWTISNGVCATSQDQVSITVYPATVPGVLASDATVCATANSGTLSLTGYSSSILRWESSIDNGTTWNNIANTGSSYTYNNLTATTRYRAYVQNAVCPALYSNIATINVVQAATVANAGPDEIIVNGVSSTRLNGNVPTSGTGTWTQISGPTTLSFSNPNDPKATVGGLNFVAGTPPTDGIYQLRWTISNGVCAVSEDAMQLTVQPPTNPGRIGPDAVVCTSNNHGTLVLSEYLGIILQWEYSIDYGVTWNVIASTVGTNQNTYDYNNLTTTTLFRALVQNGVGLPLYSGIAATVTVLQLVTPADAGADQAVCNSTTTVLAGNTPTSGTGTWSQVSGPTTVSFSNASDPASIVNGLTTGTYQLAWAIANGICSDSKDIMEITVYGPTVTGSLAAAATVCATANSGTLSLTGYVSSVVRWEYSTNSGASWNNIASTTDTYTYNNLSTTTAYRAYVQNVVCPALYSNIVTVTVIDAVTPANAGVDQQLCNVTSATLNGNAPTSGTGTWSFVSGPSAVSFTNPNDPNTTVNGLTAGTYQLAWNITNGLCIPSQDIVQITVYPPTVAGSLAAAATVCATANSGTLSLTGYVSSVVRWEYSTNNGASWNNMASTTDTYTYNNLSATTAYRAYVQNAVCPALYSNTVTINVVQAVTTANAGTDQQLCNVTSATLNGNTPTSGTGTWSFVSGPSAVSFTNPNDPNTTVNGLTAGTYQLAWTIANNICSASQDVMQITISPATNSGKLVADAFVCVAGNDGNLSLSGYTGNIIRWEQSVDNGITWASISNTSNSYAYKNLQATTQYRALVQSGICSSEYSNTVTIHVYQLSVGGKLSPNQRTVCITANSGSLQLAGFTGTIQQWESSADSGKSWTILAHTDTSYTYTSLATTTWFRVLIKNGSCSATYSDTARIQVDAATVAGTLAGGNILCSGINSGALRLSGRKGAVIHWEYSTDNGSNWNLMVNTTDSLFYNNLTANTLFRTLIKNGACAIEYSNSVLITVVPPVTIANAGPDQILCNADNATLLQANTPVNGAGTWSQASGPSNVSFINPSLPNSMVTGLRTGTYRFVWSISNGICANSTDTVTIKVDRVLSAFTLSSINDCGKTTYRFNNTSQSVFGIRNHQWYTSTGDTMLQKNVTLSYTTEGERNMVLAVESNTGCSHKTEAIYKVVIYEFPKANINAIADACRSQLFQASAEVNSKDSIAYMLWNLGNGSKPRDSIVSVQFMSDGNYTVKLTVATVNRCFDSAFKQISVHPIPVVTIDTKPVVCRGDSAILSANGAMNYIWTDQDNRIICDGCTTTRVKPTYNSTYKVLGYDQYGCSQITTTEVRVIQPLKMIASLNDTICVGQSRQLFAKGAASYSWYPETGLNNSRSSAPVARPTVTTTYQVVGKDNYDCFTDSANVRITVGNPTRIHIGNDTTVVVGGSYQLRATPEVQDIRKWYWSGPADFSCKTCPDPTVKVTNDASIYCLAINAYGCTSTDTLSIKTFCPATDVFIPNAFSPDGDGINDVLVVQGKGIKMIKSFRIFNRWGEVVFEKTNFLPGDPAYAWDGKIRGNPAPPDVFVYVCEVICEKGVPSIFKGNTAVLK